MIREVITRNLGDNVGMETYTSWWRPLLLDSTSVNEQKRGKYIRIEERTSDPQIRKSVVSLIGGHWATRSNEIAISESLAKTWKLNVGENLTLEMPRLSLKVVGLVRTHYQLKDNVIFSSANSGLEVANIRTNASLLVQSDTPITAQKLHEITQVEQKILASDGDLEALIAGARLPGSNLAVALPAVSWLAVLTVIAFAVMSIVISAAFATSARRQLTTVGQLSANGASASLIQRALALQGAWSGLVGILLATVVTVVLLTFSRSQMESLAGYSIPALRLPTTEYVLASVIAIFASVGAAWLPSRTAAQTSVLNALAGRRGEAPVRRSLLPAGLLLFGSGVGLEFLVALGVQNSEGQSSPFLVAGSIGGLLILAGVCCMGPVIVSLFHFIGEKSSGEGRLMARGLSRNRSRSSAVVVSIATFTGLGIAVAMGASSREVLYDNSYIPRNVVEVSTSKCGETYRGLPFECTPRRADGEFEDAVKKVLQANGNVKQVSLDYAVANGVDPDFFASDFGKVEGELLTENILIANPTILEILQMSKRDLKEFNDVGIVFAIDPELKSIYDPANVQGDFNTLSVPLAQGIFQYPMHQLQDDAQSWGRWRILMTEKRAKEGGFTIFKDSARLFIGEKNLSESQLVQLSFLRSIAAESQPVVYDDQGALPRPGTDFAYSDVMPPISQNSVHAFIAGSLLVLVLLIVAIGLSLMASEGKDERDILLAIGAAPTTMSKLAGLRALWLSAVGIAIAIPVAVIPMVVVLKAGADPGTDPVDVPWSLFALLGGVPLVAYIAARITSAIVQIIRPIHVSNAQFE
jgi:ABC-type lipoprotein release transport system permease subunit